MNRTKKTPRAQSHMIQSESVMNQLNELEKKSLASQEVNKRGSTNEIQPLVTDDGLNQ